jgi:hypothetical protein
MLHASGFERVCEETRQVPWMFDSRPDLLRFFKGLFGLTSTLEDIARAIDDYLDVQTSASGLQVDWALIYAYGRRPLSPACPAPG